MIAETNLGACDTAQTPRPGGGGSGDLNPAKGANPNCISSSGHGCPDRFRLDQLSWPVLAERHCTMVNCNPNCNLVHDSRA